jgi:glutathione S-transferase
MALIIYGSSRSRTLRVLWMAAELALDYEHIPFTWDDPALKEPEFLKLNPARTIPTIVDDGFALSESLAITLYLAKTYGSDGANPLYPTSPREEAEVWRWSLWAQGHLEPWVQRDLRMAALRDLAPDALRAMTTAPLGHLDRVLADRAWLVGTHFTVADLNVRSVLSPSRTEHLDLAPYPALRDWLERCHARPAALETRRRFQG